MLITTLRKFVAKLAQKSKIDAKSTQKSTMLLLEKNGWWRDKSNANTFIHPQLGTDNKIVFKDNVPVFHNVQIPYVHQLQNVLHEHNENISIHMQIFNI